MIINLITKANKAFQPICLMAFLLLTILSCEQDFVNIDSTLQGAQNFNTNKQEFPLLTYSKAYGEAQTNSVSSNLIGYFNEPIYGKTVASVVTQVTPTEFGPDFGNNPKIKSVKLNIPYFSTVIGDTNAAGITPHRLDSVFGNITASFKLSIYQSNYLLRELDPNSNFEDPQAYYSNAIQDLNINSQLGQLIFVDDKFFPRTTEVIVDQSDPENVVRAAPALNLELNKDAVNNDFWRDLLMDEDGNALPHLLNANNFRAFFRGLIFKAEPNADNPDGAHQIMLDFANTNANITINYTNENDDEEEVDQTYVLNFSGVRLNALENDFNFPLPNGNPATGDDKLFVKGGVGSAAIINLFNGDIENENGEMVPSEVFFKNKKDSWLINQANLTVFVDQASIPNNIDGKGEPNRLVLYDLKNNLPIADYFLDVNTINPDPNLSRTLYAEPLERDSNNRGVAYKFRITEHINNILKRDSTNVNLGIYVSTNVNLLFTDGTSLPNNSLTFESVEDEDDTTLDRVPTTSVLSPRGTVLHGSTTNVPENLRPKLEIFYTEPEN